jgi:hypothetical protein
MSSNVIKNQPAPCESPFNNDVPAAPYALKPVPLMVNVVLKLTLENIVSINPISLYEN